MTQSKSKKTIPKRSRRIIIATTIIAVAILMAFIAIRFLGTTINHEVRKDRIIEIYSSLNLGDDYLLQDENIFGEKRIYEWDKGRSYSSSREYIRAAGVDDTVNDLKQRITNAGFTFIDEPYPGSASIQFHYKSENGEYIRMSVSSKPWNDAFQNNVLMGKKVPNNLDPKAGPSDILIKVNLDDNNE